MIILSVVIPAYNAEKTLGTCLQAVCASDFRNYELIVVDDGSRDTTPILAKEYADKVISHERNLGRAYARNSGIEAARGKFLVFIDADVAIKRDTLKKIADFFSSHHDYDAVTGLLSKEHPNSNFFSQYKNLYMNYIFNKLPERVNFLYGSICSVRRRASLKLCHDVKIADDTALGQKLHREGKQIRFLRDLEVVHHKTYNFISFLKNDFQIPFDWAHIFIQYQGWKLLGKRKTGFLHSPKEQLVSVTLAPLLLGLTAVNSSLGPGIHFFSAGLLSLWLILNLRFFMFLTREQGYGFGILSISMTFIDHLTMAAGILCGLISCFFQKTRKPHFMEGILQWQKKLPSSSVQGRQD